MVEIGPHPVLLAMGQACVPDADSGSIQWLRTLARGASDWDGILASLGALYERGVEIDWSPVRRSARQTPRQRANLSVAAQTLLVSQERARGQSRGSLNIPRRRRTGFMKFNGYPGHA